jgi:hypothetical protein
MVEDVQVSVARLATASRVSSRSSALSEATTKHRSMPPPDRNAVTEVAGAPTGSVWPMCWERFAETRPDVPLLAAGAACRWAGGPGGVARRIPRSALVGAPRP